MIENDEMMRLAAVRHAVAEWRDRHIVAASTMVNFRAVEARKALEVELRDVSGFDSMLNPSRLARQRIDFLMGFSLKPDMAGLIRVAADELGCIDDRLAGLKAAFGSVAITFPEGPPIAGHDAMELLEIGSESHGGSGAVGDDQGLAGLGRKLQEGVAALSRSASTATDSILNERLGLINRVRSAAAERIETAWMNEANEAAEPGGVLHQLVFAIDGTAQEARIQLS